MHLVGRSFAGLALWLLAGCSPTFDWRETRVVDGLTSLFPCRPQVNTRRIVMAGDTMTMQLTSCSAGELTFAIGRLDVADATRVEPVEQVLREALRVNLAATAQTAASDNSSLRGDGSTQIDGTGPDGKPMQARSRIFHAATTVFQATVIGRRLEPEAVDFFFSSIKASS